MRIDKASGEYAMTKYEFWFLILLIVSIMCLVGYVSFVNAGNGSALNFVSFSATLISILLAVVAIGYTYGESVAERSKTDKLSSQISRLTDANDVMDIHAETLSNISSKMDEHFRATQSQLNIVKSENQSAIEELISMQKAEVSSSEEVKGENDYSSQETIRSLMLKSNRQIRVSLILMLYICKEYINFSPRNDNDTSRGIFPDFIIDVCRQVCGDSDDASREFVATLAHCQLLTAFLVDIRMISDYNCSSIPDQENFDYIFQALIESGIPTDVAWFDTSILENLVKEYMP